MISGNKEGLLLMRLQLTREQKQQFIEDVQYYFETERGESIGSIAAEGFIDNMISLLGPAIYNQALGDARKLLMERVAAIEDELYALEKPNRPAIR